MRAAVLNRPGEVEVVERPTPEPGRHEVLVRVRAVGVCGSDTHYYDHGRIGRFVVEAPLVLGHESAGVIEAVGEHVDPARIGQRVSIEPGVPCRRCTECLAGRYNLCPDMVFYATPPVDGSLAELAVIDEAFAHPVPDGVSDEAAALLEPLSVGIWACRKGGVGPGSRVLVTGAGPIGIVAAQVARASGAAEVVVADVNPHRLSAATALGASRAVNTAETSLEQAYAGRPGPEVLLECSGHPGATADGIRALAPAGVAVLVGMGGDELPLPLSVVQERELTVTGTFRYANTWPTAIALVATGQVDLDALVTARFPLAEAERALTASRDDPRALKAVILPQQ
ncbi:NAD(P)-dependent alcohol dehydrogenase [Phycicoccus sp. SLBN-51]|uniref:NAD(P)-dependent alcohol dehydrogenase n=1 Tax=Phycicoccus sp. SLBN-51 TaxID=2768447 RepID=UPI00114F778A|nr:NAD(P)-dependent alcohol dehydrogenase [Phycicoccus sp. SLBN-51]TQJ48747.1 L-iditol 2-dehydrogenase [Phycicoccus sp. SLBN-51]